MANSTASSLLSTALDILKLDSNSGPAGVGDTRLLTVLDYANREFINAPYYGSDVGWDFMKKESGLTLVTDTTLTAAQATTDVTLTVTSNANFDSSGSLVVWTSGMPDTEDYTALSSTTGFTGVTGIAFAHASGDGCQKLYALPADFYRIRQAKGYQDGVQVSGVPYSFISGIPTSANYSIYDNGTTKYLWFPRGLTGTAAIVYDKAASSISATTSTVDVPVQHEEFLVYRLVEHGARVLDMGPDIIQNARQLADSALQKALNAKMIGKRVSLTWGAYPRRVLINGKQWFYQ